MNNRTWLWFVVVLALAMASYFMFGSLGKEPVGDDTQQEVDTSESQSTDSRFINYTPEAAMAAAEEGDAVLFFHAPWCPTCRALEADINSHLADIPENVTILKTDYDTYRAMDLGKKFGITIQHTLVQVDIDNNQIKKWSGSPTLSSLLAEIV
ncbi:MAG: thioredoxin domain-containing protein [Patescibacteria group bacterium]